MPENLQLATLQPVTSTAQRAAEISQKLEWMREALREANAAGVRLVGVDWFAWATAGGSNVVLLTSEAGVAEVLVTLEGAWILTDEIEAQRLKEEELPVQSGYEWAVQPWATRETDRAAFVKEVTQGEKVISDAAQSSHPLPPSLINRKRVLMASECDRYRHIGRLASEAMTEVLEQSRPDWTEFQLAGAGANALWKRGLHPALTLAAGEKRLPKYRHTPPKEESLGRAAMLVFCGCGFGLCASLTRFVYFDRLSPSEAERHRQVREIEAAGLDCCQVETPLDQIYHTLKRAYEQQGYPKAIYEHHQGGITGYLSREAIATPDTRDRLLPHMAMAWNPSLPGAKVEDTFLLLEDNRLENLTLDARWKSVEVNGRSRPLPLELS
jgi:Xaa-Pro aminopeptidase